VKYSDGKESIEKALSSSLLSKPIEENQVIEFISKESTKVNKVSELLSLIGFDLSKYLDILKEIKTAEDTAKTKKLLAGKTFYMAYKEDGILIVEKDVVNSNATLITWTNIEGNTNKGTVKITKIEGKFTYTEGYDGTISKTELLEVTDKYFSFLDNGKIKKSFFTIADAKANLNNSTNGDNGSATGDLAKLIVGKTYYVTADDEEVATPHVETLAFDDNKTVTDTWIEDGTTHKYIFSYSIDKNTLTISGINSGGDYFNFTFNGTITQTDNYIQFENGGKFYKSYEAAEAALNK